MGWDIKPWEYERQNKEREFKTKNYQFNQCLESLSVWIWQYLRRDPIWIRANVWPTKYMGSEFLKSMIILASTKLGWKSEQYLSVTEQKINTCKSSCCGGGFFPCPLNPYQPVSYFFIYSSPQCYWSVHIFGHSRSENLFISSFQNMESERVRD